MNRLLQDDRLDVQKLARIDPQLLCPVKHRSAKAQADLIENTQLAPSEHRSSRVRRKLSHVE